MSRTSSNTGRGMIEERDVIIVGAGFAGMYMLHRLRRLGQPAMIIEAGGGVGGTWYWNRYPGARCDVESMSYSYSFSEELQQDWDWPHRYAAQPDILRYANHVADRFDLRKDILFNARIASAHFDEKCSRWIVDAGSGGLFSARFLIMATGCLSVPKTPELPGLGSFRGRVLHTASWPAEDVDFSGKSVAIIGTGSSGIQSIPIIAERAAHLTVFQRTANFSIPAWNAALAPENAVEKKRNYGALRRKSRNSYSGDYADEYYVSVLNLTPAEREAHFEKRWLEGGFNFQYAFADLMVSAEANELAAEFVRNKIRALVRDPKIAELLCPKGYPFGTKRLCVDTNYYETFNRPNVTLVDIKSDPIAEITPRGLRSRSAEYEFDVLVLATGFDAMTGALTSIDIAGRAGRLLKDEWRSGAEAYLGMVIAGFPNLFVITGPGSPSVLANMVLAGEQHVEWISDLLHHSQANGITHIEADDHAQREWAREVTESAERTLYVKAESWYLGANVPGKPRRFLPYVDGFNTYSRICDKIAADGYVGLNLKRECPTTGR
ncbi:MAG: cyclohexanone monooxygenase [Gammaproteobacteria bacterium]|nr:cyclohexanone monooxygenase [Gammaproteobacteria bacterium]